MVTLAMWRAGRGGSSVQAGRHGPRCRASISGNEMPWSGLHKTSTYGDWLWGYDVKIDLYNLNAVGESSERFKPWVSLHASQGSTK